MRRQPVATGMSTGGHAVCCLRTAANGRITVGHAARRAVIKPIACALRLPSACPAVIMIVGRTAPYGHRALCCAKYMSRRRARGTPQPVAAPRRTDPTTVGAHEPHRRAGRRRPARLRRRVPVALPRRRGDGPPARGGRLHPARGARPVGAAAGRRAVRRARRRQRRRRSASAARRCRTPGCAWSARTPTRRPSRCGRATTSSAGATGWSASSRTAGCSRTPGSTASSPSPGASPCAAPTAGSTCASSSCPAGRCACRRSRSTSTAACARG